MSKDDMDKFENEERPIKKIGIIGSLNKVWWGERNQKYVEIH